MSGFKMSFVSAVAGAAKTDEALRYAIRRAAAGSQIIIAMPTLDVIREKIERSEYFKAQMGLANVEIKRIDTSSIPQGRQVHSEIRLCLTGQAGPCEKAMITYPDHGFVLFITHKALVDMPDGWGFAGPYELIIDEVPDITRSVSLKLRHNYRIAEQLFHWEPPPPLHSNAKELKRLTAVLPKVKALADRGGTAGEKSAAQARLAEITTKLAALEASNYYILIKRYDEYADGALTWDGNTYASQEKKIKITYGMRENDDVDAVFGDVLEMAIAGSMDLYVNREAWDNMRQADRLPDGKLAKKVHDRGHITISAVISPDFLKPFKKVTIMSALFEHSLLYQLWRNQGVQWSESSDIVVTTPRTKLGSRNLTIYYLMGGEERWSKTARDNRVEGGLAALRPAFDKLFGAEPVCVVVNRDVGDDAWNLVEHPIRMPNVSHGSNRWFKYHNVVYLSALNGTPADIAFLNEIGGISAEEQNIARTGSAAYQSLMRCSLRDPKAEADVKLVIGDERAANFVAQWFSPRDQVRVIPLDSGRVIKKRRGATAEGGRQPTYGEGTRAGTAAERKRRERARKKGTILT